MKRRLAEVESSVERYLEQLTEVDAIETDDDKGPVLEKKITRLREEMARLKKCEVRMLEAPDKQLSLTDPDARSMTSRGTGLVGYNVQSAVDSEHHLIIAHEVTNVGSDRRQLANVAKQAKAVLERDTLDVVADRGYYNGDEIRACEQAGIDAYLPKPKTSGNKAKGLFDRAAFNYIDSNDEYECPAGERLTYRCMSNDRGKDVRRYWSSACPRCPIKTQCTTGDNRRVSRWVHADVLDRAQARLEKQPDAMRVRRATVEHPFGTLKSWMGATHFQMKTLPRVSTEMSLHVLAYNMKRAINLLGTKEILAAIRA
jgi:hypothetical protein